MSFLESLLTWANVPFTAAMATVLSFAALQASGVLGLLAGSDADHAGGDHDLSGDVDGHADLHADVDGDAGGDADGGGDADSDVDADADASGDHVAHDAGGNDADHAGGRVGHAGHYIDGGLLANVGVGKVPTSLIWQTFAMAFGILGVAANSVVLIATGHLPTPALALSLPVAVVGGYGITAAVTRLVARIATVQEASGRRDLVGLPGVVVTGQVDENFGEVRVKLLEGDFAQVSCRVLPGEKPIGKDEPVVVVKYDREDDRLYVAPLPPEPTEAQSIPTRAQVGGAS
jgi:hypothetical protein